jgi:hypothetical protein
MKKKVGKKKHTEKIKFYRKYRKELLLGVTAAILAVLLFYKPAPHERILNIQNYLITVGGIISAFVTAYLSAKIFNVRQERDNRQSEINTHSARLTDFRRLLYFMLSSREFWLHYEDIRKLKIKYPGMTHARLRGQPLDAEALKVYEDNELSFSTIALAMAMMELYGDPDKERNLAWALDKSVTFDYSIEDLLKYHDPCNQIWYYLDGRFAKHGRGRFSDSEINPLWRPYIEELLYKLEPKNKGKDFHRIQLAELAADMYGFTIPTLLRLTRKNIGIPNSLIQTFKSLFIIMAFGVILPIVIQSIQLSDKIDTLLTLFCVWVTVLGLASFLFDFFSFLEEDVHVVQKK